MKPTKYNSFESNGYIIKENFVDDKYHSELFYLFYNLYILEKIEYLSI